MCHGVWECFWELSDVCLDKKTFQRVVKYILEELSYVVGFELNSNTSHTTFPG